MKVTNGIFKGELKVKGGKYIKCSLAVDDERIKTITFTGDFFMHPEEKIEELEKRLVGIKITEETLDAELKNFFETVDVIGATAEDFVTVIVASFDN